MIPPRVRDVHFHAADDEHRGRGTVGWVTADIDSVRVDQITLRRARDGRLVCRFPERIGKDGTRFPTVRPRGPDERAAIEHALITAIKHQGHRL